MRGSGSVSSRRRMIDCRVQIQGGRAELRAASRSVRGCMVVCRPGGRSIPARLKGSNGSMSRCDDEAVAKKATNKETASAILTNTRQGRAAYARFVNWRIEYQEEAVLLHS